MQNESLELSFLSIFSVLSFFTFFIIQKISQNLFKGKILDDDFAKPQAFHDNSISRSGGLASLISFYIFLFLYNFLFSIFYIEYFFICTGIFLIGFLEDIKIRLSPKIRLVLMIILLLITIPTFSIEINYIDLVFLNEILKFKIFLVLFTSLCFLFVINGCNLIDGFNGLLAIQLIVINSILMFISIDNSFQILTIFITAQIIMLLIFLLFNFPIAKIFMGDGGAYFFGTMTALNIILVNNSNFEISSFFFCIILFYLFFEVFFSFFRKIYQNKSPIKPDDKHLHMLSYKILKSKYSNKDCNYINSIVINLSYFILIIPSLLFKENAALCKYWFFLLIIIYIFTYSRLNSFLKKKIDI